MNRSVSTIPPSHPRRTLLFSIVGELTDEVRAEVQEFVSNLAQARDWMIGPPTFINESTQTEHDAPDDQPIETLGGYVEIYSSLPPARLSRDVDLKQLEDVTELTNLLAEFSRSHDLDLEFELDGELIGSIRGGVISRTLNEGLIEEWRRRLSIRG